MRDRLPGIEGVPGASGAVAERFSETERVDLVSVTRRFYTSHPDVFDQLVVHTTRPMNPVAGGRGIADTTLP